MVVQTLANGCSSSDSVLIFVNPIPEVDFISDLEKGCEPLLILFTDQTIPTSNNVIWDFGDGSTSNSLGNIAHIYTNSGDYSVSLVATVNGCSNTKTISQMIHVYENATADFSVDHYQTNIDHPSFTFTNNSINSNLNSWEFGDEINSIETNPTHTFKPIAGTYEVTLIANNDHNCPDTSKMEIQIIEPLLFYVPNTFTPDGDTYNEEFKPVMTSGFEPKSYNMQIYNRWGELVFQTTDISTGWDGRFIGEKVQDGTLTWVINFKDKLSDKKYTYKGHLNIIK